MALTSSQYVALEKRLFAANDRAIAAGDVATQETIQETRDWMQSIGAEYHVAAELVAAIERRYPPRAAAKPKPKASPAGDPSPGAPADGSAALVPVGPVARARGWWAERSTVEQLAIAGAVVAAGYLAYKAVSR